MHNAAFWKNLQELVSTSQLHIDRPKQSSHPRFPELIYPYDYGELLGTQGGDGQGIDIWLGRLDGPKTVVGLLATADTLKKDTELKIMLDCTPEQMQEIADWYNKVMNLPCLLVARGYEL